MAEMFSISSIHSLNKAVTFSHQVHGSGSSLAYLQYRRGTPSTTEVAEALTFSHQVHGSGSSLAYLQYRRGTPVNHRGIGTVPSALIILRSSGDHFRTVRASCYER
ncbi:hypothetical protein CDAR_524181 [Caerostris darwini]|uniref:Uncharacterized protein n=1 Tax=Caerostris darwini TaxID=1538125 RepID=A0AAV4VWQ8_9ARAC|nr:hypothetical protein CDAR_524181 [Caerostris darwini]